jgi:hypothetical protein
MSCACSVTQPASNSVIPVNQMCPPFGAPGQKSIPKQISCCEKVSQPILVPDSLPAVLEISFTRPVKHNPNFNDIIFPAIFACGINRGCFLSPKELSPELCSLYSVYEIDPVATPWLYYGECYTVQSGQLISTTNTFQTTDIANLSGWSLHINGQVTTLTGAVNHGTYIEYQLPGITVTDSCGAFKLIKHHWVKGHLTGCHHQFFVPEELTCLAESNPVKLQLIVPGYPSTQIYLGNADDL